MGQQQVKRRRIARGSLSASALGLVIASGLGACGGADECTDAADKIEECGIALSGDASCKNDEDLCAAACFADADCDEIEEYLDPDAAADSELATCVAGCVAADEYFDNGSASGDGLSSGVPEPIGAGTVPYGTVSDGTVPYGTQVGVAPVMPGDTGTTVGGVPGLACGSTECEISSNLANCCTNDDNCGVYLSGYCVDIDVADNDCSFPSCCTPEGYCGTTASEAGDCFVPLFSSGDIETCDGELQPYTCDDDQECNSDAIFAFSGLIDAIGLCCASGGGCGILDSDYDCIDVSAWEPNCPSLDGRPGCCLGDNQCGVSASDGGDCEAGEAIEDATTLPSSWPTCDGETEVRCGEMLCDADLVETASSIFWGLCCAESGGCGLSDSNGNCIAEDDVDVDVDCPGGCCTSEGFCGYLEEGSCRVTLGFEATTDCDGNITPFACDGSVCPEGDFGDVACCTQEDECGRVVGGDCIARSVIDTQCPTPAGGVACCAADDLCGVWDGSADECLQTEADDGELLATCDGSTLIQCPDDLCEESVSVTGDFLLTGCCLDSGGCGATEGDGCFPAEIFDAYCPGTSVPIGCCVDGEVCGVFDSETASCIADASVEGYTCSTP